MSFVPYALLQGKSVATAQEVAERIHEETP